uniref:Uncharacterized protein n=1 Tax=Peronospora matthiolae TaxID=2874970 RepID=A0AAV1VJS5_9STRA
MTAPLCRNDSSSISCAEMTAPVRVPHVVHSLPMSGCMSVLASNTARRWEAQLLLGLNALCRNDSSNGKRNCCWALDAVMQ